MHLHFIYALAVVFAFSSIQGAAELFDLPSASFREIAPAVVSLHELWTYQGG